MSREKEVNFFSEHYDKGVLWYSKFFEKRRKEEIAGEFSPRYLSHAMAPHRIKETVPDAKLIVCLRNPVDQLFSRYHYMVARQMYSKSFEAVLEDKPHLIKGAFYYKHLSRYMEYFSPDRICVLIYDDLKAEPGAFLKGIFNFLSVRAGILPSRLNEKIHHTRIPRSRLMEANLVVARKILRKMRLLPVVDALKARCLDKTIKRVNTRKNGSFKEMDPKTRERLNDIFAEDKEKLSELIGRDLSFWA